jgi:3'(2'), 5'-bisphosphate nucleotidase
MGEYDREREAALDAIGQAATLCRAVQAEITPSVLEKKDRSPVTVADFGSQALVCRRIARAFPGDPIIGEEDAQSLRDPENAELLSRLVGQVRALAPDAGADEICAWIDRGGASEFSDRFWTLDPIDGTKGFLRKEQYAVSLALVVKGEIVLGALACPNLPAGRGRAGGAAFIAVRGEGAFQLPLDGDGEPEAVSVSVRADPTLARFCESVEKGHSSQGDAARIAERLGIKAEPVRLDSQAKYAVVARGDAEAYLRLPKDDAYREKIWDHAGGVLVVTEAGGRVTDVTGRPLELTHGRTLARNRGVIVTNGLIHERILSAIRDLAIA